MTVKNFLVEKDDEGLRIDVFVANKSGKTRSAVARLIDEQKIKCKGKSVKASYIVKNGDVIEYQEEPPQQYDIVAQDLPLEIVYQDEALAVINKPQGMTTHPSGNNVEGTLVNALLFKLDNLSGINGVIRPGIVHRLDKDTSGLLVVAKCDEAHLSLSAQIASKVCRRFYRAIVEGVVKQDEGTIIAPIGRDAANRKKMAVTATGKHAVTHFNVLKRFNQHTYMQFELESGRTHQIRVHCQHIGHPIVGDKAYGYKKQKFNLNGQLLHAYSIAFFHPFTNEQMQFFAPLPDYFTNCLNILDNDSQQ